LHKRNETRSRRSSTTTCALMPAEHVDAFRRANRGFNTSYD
jgi:hypothetical protein